LHIHVLRDTRTILSIVALLLYPPYGLGGIVGLFVGWVKRSVPISS